MTRFLLGAAALLVAGASTACTTSREIIPLNGPDGSPIRFVYRHEMRAKDSERRDPIVNALVGVKSSDDAVWQISFTDEAGGARLSQEYPRTDVYNDRRTMFFVTTQNTIVLRAPGFQMTVRHPSYVTYDIGYGSMSFLDRPHLCPDPASPTATPAGVPPHAYAQLSRPILASLELREGVERPAEGAPMPPAPQATLAFVADALGGPSVEVRHNVDGYNTGGGGALMGGPLVHDGRFDRTTDELLRLERATKLYYRAEDEAYVLLGPVFGAGESRASQAKEDALADTADVVLHCHEALAPGAKPPSRRWVKADLEPGARDEARLGVLTAALDATLKSGGKRAAIVYPVRTLPAVEAKLRERSFELLAEWWLPASE